MSLTEIHDNTQTHTRKKPRKKPTTARKKQPVKTPPIAEKCMLFFLFLFLLVFLRVVCVDYLSLSVRICITIADDEWRMCVGIPADRCKSISLLKLVHTVLNRMKEDRIRIRIRIRIYFSLNRRRRRHCHRQVK